MTQPDEKSPGKCKTAQFQIDQSITQKWDPSREAQNHSNCITWKGKWWLTWNVGFCWMTPMSHVCHIRCLKWLTNDKINITDQQHIMIQHMFSRKIKIPENCSISKSHFSPWQQQIVILCFQVNSTQITVIGDPPTKAQKHFHDTTWMKKYTKKWKMNPAQNMAEKHVMWTFI